MNISNNLKKILDKFFPYLLILIATIFICIPLLKNDINMFRDDGIQHICRLMGTYQSIKEGQIIPVIMSKFCNGFGYSWNLFYSPLTAFTPLIFKIIGCTYTSCIKIFMFLVVYLSGITMFLFTKEITKNKKIAILAGVLYVFVPYRITDMYIRNALAELTSFIFLPMIFNGIYQIINENKKNYLLEIGTIGLILTHTIITLYMGIICAIYILINIKKLQNKQVLKTIILNLLFAIIITSFFWVPLLQHKMTTNYEVFVPGRMEREDILIYYKIEPTELLKTEKDQKMIYELGIVTWIGLLLTAFAIKKIPKEYKKLYIMFLITGSILTIMTLTIFPFEKLPAIFKMIQFTFRLLEFISFLFITVVAINYGIVIKNFRIRDVIILSIIAGMLLIPYRDKIEYKKNDENNLWPAVLLTENTGRVHAGMASFEYLPSKAFDNKTYIINRQEGPIILKGSASIDYFDKNGTSANMILSDVSEGTEIELPYIYYLGYNITLNNNDKIENVKYNESDNGFIEITIPYKTEKCEINVRYTGTKAMKVSILLSIIVILGQIVVLFKKRYNNSAKNT